MVEGVTSASVLESVEFAVDMNGVDQPSADYDNVVVNGSWNGWQGWGVTLADEDGLLAGRVVRRRHDLARLWVDHLAALQVELVRLLAQLLGILELLLEFLLPAVIEFDD